MTKRGARGAALLILFLGVGIAQPAPAQDAAGELDTIRALSNISANDADQIDRWVRGQFEHLAASPREARGNPLGPIREAFARQRKARDASPQFQEKLVTLTSKYAAEVLGSADLDSDVAFALAFVLADFDRGETIAALVAGLKAKSPRARFKCADALAARTGDIAAEKQLLDSTVAALRAAGLVEDQPVILSRIYRALAYREQVDAVFDAYIALLDKRLEYRRGPAVVADGAENEAYEFFRTRTVLGSLSADRQAQLVSRLAVLFRMDAERYNDQRVGPPTTAGTADLTFRERETLERSMTAIESILTALVQGKPAGVAEALKTGGWSTIRAAVLARVYEWVGDPKTNSQGFLNQAPWNVPIGAP